MRIPSFVMGPHNEGCRACSECISMKYFGIFSSCSSIDGIACTVMYAFKIKHLIKYLAAVNFKERKPQVPTPHPKAAVSHVACARGSSGVLMLFPTPLSDASFTPGTFPFSSSITSSCLVGIYPFPPPIASFLFSSKISFLLPFH